MKYAIRTVLAVSAITIAACSFSGKTEKPVEPETMPDDMKVMGDAEIKPCTF